MLTEKDVNECDNEKNKIKAGPRNRWTKLPTYGRPPARRYGHSAAFIPVADVIYFIKSNNTTKLEF